MSEKVEVRLRPGRAQDLVVPIYLDIPTTVSLVAALEGGVAFSRRSTSASRGHSATEGGGKAGLSIPLISSLLKVDVSGDLRAKQENDVDEAVEIERQHTAVSLFNLLRSRLTELELVKTISTPADLPSLLPGDLVTMDGRVLGDPVLALADAIAELSLALRDVMQVGPAAAFLESLFKAGVQGSATSSDPNAKLASEILLSAIFPKASPALSPPPKTATAGHRRHDSVPARSGPVPPSAAGTASADLVDQASALLTKVRDGLRDGPVNDLLVTGSELRAVVPVTRSYLEVQSTELMKDADLTVVGKVTRVLRDDGDRVDLLRRSIIRYLSPATADKAYAYLRDRRFLNLDLAELVVKAPAVQILPLAVYI